MKIESIISIVNTLCGDNKFARARQIIVQEWSRISESKNYHLLNTSAQEFMKIINDEMKKGNLDTLSITDKKTLNLINTLVRNSQFKYAKRIMTEHQSLLEKPEAQSWLISDAKIIFDAWKHSL